MEDTYRHIHRRVRTLQGLKVQMLERNLHMAGATLAVAAAGLLIWDAGALTSSHQPLADLALALPNLFVEVFDDKLDRRKVPF